MTKVWPTTGPMHGGTVVTLWGANFVDRYRLVCRFGTVLGTRHGSWRSASMIECVSPASGAAGSVPLEMSNNNQQFTTDALPFEYEVNAHVQRLFPTHGPASGGSTVTIYGSAFVDSPSLYARFGPVRVRPTFVTATELVSVAPGNAAGGVNGTQPVEVANNNQDFTFDNVAYLYQPEVVINGTLTPPSGPTFGGTIVTVTGAEFWDRDLPLCRFGGVISATVPTIVSSSELVCRTPAHVAGNATVELAMNGHSFTNWRVAWTYYEQAAVTHLAPTTGPMRGMSLVSVFGQRFRDTRELYCKFGAHVQVPATYRSSTMVLCLSNPWGFATSGTTPYTVPLEVSNNNQDFTTTAVSYEYTPDAHVTWIVLPKAPETSGLRTAMYIVTIVGQNFVDTPLLVCKFDALVVRGTQLNHTNVVCEHPAHEPQTIVVEVSNNNQGAACGACACACVCMCAPACARQRVCAAELTRARRAVHADFTRDGLTFTFLNATDIRGLRPRTGPSFGGTVVTLFGDSIDATSSCRFGTLELTTANATVLSSTEVRCMSPPQPPGDYLLEVTNNRMGACVRAFVRWCVRVCADVQRAAQTTRTSGACTRTTSRRA
jgi:hypothetical protein